MLGVAVFTSSSFIYNVVDYLYLLQVALPTLQISIGKLKCSMVVFSRIQYFLSFIVSNIRTIPAFH